MGLLLLLLLFLSSCEPQLPDGVMSESKMEEVLYDYHVAQAMSEVSTEPGKTIDFQRYELQEAVLRKHGITQAEFDSSMVFYCSDLDRMNRLYQHLSERLDRDAEALGASLGSGDIYAGLTADGDTANVWSGRQLFAIRNRSGENLRSWYIPCDSTWLPGDDLLFRFQTQTYARDGYYSIYVTMVVTYDNDSVRARTMQFTARTSGELRINNPEGWVARGVNGFFYIPADNDPQRLCIDIVNRISLIRFHQTQEWRNRLNTPDSLATDSIPADTLAVTSSRSAGAITLDTLDHRRSPLEFRNQQDVEQKINVVKEKPYQLPKRRKPNQQQRRKR